MQAAPPLKAAERCHGLASFAPMNLEVRHQIYKLVVVYWYGSHMLISGASMFIYWYMSPVIIEVHWFTCLQPTTARVCYRKNCDFDSTHNKGVLRGETNFSQRWWYLQSRLQNCGGKAPILSWVYRLAQIERDRSIDQSICWLNG